jgi:hypothetical protein
MTRTMLAEDVVEHRKKSELRHTTQFYGTNTYSLNKKHYHTCYVGRWLRCFCLDFSTANADVEQLTGQLEFHTYSV